MDYRSEAPAVLRDFLSYHETIKGHSRATVDEYFLDLRNFFRYLKIERGLVPRSTELDEISIKDIDLDSLDVVEIALECENEFGITIDVEEPPKTMGEFVALVDSLIG